MGVAIGPMIIIGVAVLEEVVSEADLAVVEAVLVAVAHRGGGK